MSVKLTPQPVPANPEYGTMIGFLCAMTLFLPALTSTIFLLPLSWLLPITIVLFVISLLIGVPIAEIAFRKKQAQLDKENEGNKDHLPHLDQIKKAYGVELHSSSGGVMRAIPSDENTFITLVYDKLPEVQSVIVMFNGYESEPYDGMLTISDGVANLGIRKDNEFVPAEQIRIELDAAK